LTSLTGRRNGNSGHAKIDVSREPPPRYVHAMFEHLFARQDGWDALRLALAASSLTAALVYLRFVAGTSSPMRTANKTLTVALLALLPLTYLANGANAAPLIGLTLALALSALGDFFLALKDQQRFFVPGLTSFLAAHVAFVAVFIPYTATRDGAALAIIIATVAAAGFFLSRIAPNLGKLRLPVFAYFAVIMAMVATALSIPGASWMLGAGAILFALSDSLIAVRKFMRPFPGINEAVWITYCTAQFMITAALLALLVPAHIG
jgi:uncharacterized membrane protein YhhN